MADIPLRLKGEFDDRRLNQGLTRLQGRVKGLQQSFIGMFGALSAAIAVQQLVKFTSATIDATNALTALDVQAQRAGMSAHELLTGLQAATQGQVSLANLTVTTSNAIALLGQEAIPQLGELAEIASKASTALGTDLTAAFNDIVKGIGRQSRLILDNLGLMVSVVEANERYADSIGKATSDLTDLEKKQAFLNETLRQGRAAFGDITAAVNPFKQLSAAASDLGMALTGIFAPGIGGGLTGLATSVEGLSLTIKANEDNIRKLVAAVATLAAAVTALRIPAWIASMNLLLLATKPLVAIWATFAAGFAGTGALASTLIVQLKSLRFILMNVTTTTGGLAMWLSRIGESMKTLGVFVRVGLAPLARLAGILSVLVLAIVNWRQTLTALGSVLRVVGDLLQLLFGWLDALARLIPGVTTALDFLNKMFLSLVGAIELSFRGVSILISKLNDLIYGTDTAGDAVRRFDEALLQYSEKLGLVTAGTSEADAALAELQAAFTGLSTDGPVSEVNDLISAFLGLTITAQNAAIAMAMSQGLVTPLIGPPAPGDLLGQRGLSLTGAGSALVGEFGLDAVLGQIVGTGRTQDVARLREALGIGGGAGGGGGGGTTDPGKPVRSGFADLMQAATRAALAMLEETRARVEATAALKDEAGTRQEAHELERSRLELLQNVAGKEKDRLAAQLALAGQLEMKDKSRAFQESQERLLELQDRIAKDFLTGFKNALANFIGAFADITQALGGGPGGRLGQSLLGLGGEAFGASLFGKGGFSKGGMFAKGGLLGGMGPDIVSGLAMGAIGFGINRLFGDEPLEIKGPVDVHITDIDTRLQSFFNFRGMDPFTYSSGFRPVFEAGLY